MFNVKITNSEKR